MVTNFKKLFLLLATILVCVAADGNRWKLWSLRASSESSVETEKEIFQDFTNSEDGPTTVDISNKVTLPTDHQAEDPMTTGTTVMNDVSSNQKEGVRLLKKKGKRGKRARGPNPPGQGRKNPKKRSRKLNENSYN